MRKIALYSRVSTKDQNNLNQQIRLKQYALTLGVEYEIFEEVESTRKTRPVKMELLRRLRNKEFSSGQHLRKTIQIFVFFLRNTANLRKSA